MNAMPLAQNATQFATPQNTTQQIVNAAPQFAATAANTQSQQVIIWIFVKSKGHKTALVESCQDPVIKRNLNFCAHSVRLLRKTSFALYHFYIELKTKSWLTTHGNVLPLHLVFSSSRNLHVDNILHDLDKIPPLNT